MKITEMTAWDAAERMGSEADEADGRELLDVLLESDYKDTEEIEGNEWIALMESTPSAIAWKANRSSYRG
jgi:hypothetical protein